MAKSTNFYSTLKTSTLVLVSLAVFTFFLIDPGRVEVPNPLEMTDSERDGFKGPVRSVTFIAIRKNACRAAYHYDEMGNRTEECYYDSSGGVIERTCYHHDSSGNLYLTLSYTDSDYPTSNATEKSYYATLYDPVVPVIAREDYIKEGRTETHLDQHGNWTSRSYVARKSWKAFSEKLHTESRTLAYYDSANNNNHD